MNQKRTKKALKAKPSQSSSSTDFRKSTRTKRRQLPRQCEFIIRDDLAPNEHHPLAGLTPEQRTSMRIHDIAKVLAAVALRHAEEQVKATDAEQEK